MKRTIRFMLRYVLLPLMILAAIPTVMLIRMGMNSMPRLWRVSGAGDG